MVKRRRNMEQEQKVEQEQKEQKKVEILETEDVLKLIKDIYAKVEGASNLMKDGKLWYAINKLEGLKQKLAYTANFLDKGKEFFVKTDQDNEDNNTI
jgi:hypothetical protein